MRLAYESCHPGTWNAWAAVPSLASRCSWCCLQLPPYEVALSPELNQQIASVLHSMGTHPVAVDGGTKESAVSLLVTPDTLSEETECLDRQQSRAGIVSWSPPQQNWNPWTGCNIDEGPLAFVSCHVILMRDCWHVWAVHSLLHSCAFFTYKISCSHKLCQGLTCVYLCRQHWKTSIVTCLTTGAANDREMLPCKRLVVTWSQAHGTTVWAAVKAWFSW